uniref:ABC transporter n=1 Tax=Thermosporothrix sp. COM3 TaxID=2490863 RepID=A0A455SWN0_9CHLR|nr:ABC transporter [Thermosporothrix sp. COM3]
MLQIHRLEKQIEGRSALSIEELTIQAGEIWALVGPPGSAKTVLIKILAGLLLPSGGHITLNGTDIHLKPNICKHINVLFEEDLLYERLSAQANLNLYREIRGLPAASVHQALSLVGLSDQVHTPISKLSPSAQRRLAFARTLMGQPQVILLDLPILRADLDTTALFARLLEQQARNGVAILLTCEDLSWSGRFCTHIAEIEDGKIIEVRHTGEKQPSTKEAAHSDEEKPARREVPYKVPGRKEDRIMLFDPAEILYATSRDGKIILRTERDEAVTNLTLQELEARLQKRGFFKAHRAYLVNLQRIKAVIQYTRNSYTLLLDDAQETMIPLSKQSEKELQDLLQY